MPYNEWIESEAWLTSRQHSRHSGSDSPWSVDQKWRFAGDETWRFLAAGQLLWGSSSVRANACHGRNKLLDDRVPRRTRSNRSCAVDSDDRWMLPVWVLVLQLHKSVTRPVPI
jgi:hypothetical protein